MVATLRKALQDRSNLIVAEAAKIAAALQMTELVPDLLNAFGRLFENPLKADPKCWGKNAIVSALARLDYSSSAPFLRGSNHVQMEPVWGGQEDSAVQLRATCILSLVQSDDISRLQILRRATDALTDPADPVRLEAVRAIGQLAGDEASLLLRLKARAGDARPAVVGQVFDSLLALEPEASLRFVAEFLRAPAAEVRDEAALSLGGSRLPQAVDILKAAWKENSDWEFGGVLLRALSSSRQPGAIDFLLEFVRSGSRREASQAVDALKLHEDSPEIWSLVKEAEASRIED
jgi:HEAT repeat protein